MKYGTQYLAGNYKTHITMHKKVPKYKSKQNEVLFLNQIHSSGAPEGKEGGGVHLGPCPQQQILADQLTLSQLRGGRLNPPLTLCLEMGFTWTSLGNQDATMKSKSELISTKL